MISIHFWRRCCYLLEERALAVPSSSTLRLADCSDHDLENRHRLQFFCRNSGSISQILARFTTTLQSSSHSLPLFNMLFIAILILALLGINQANAGVRISNTLFSNNSTNVRQVKPPSVPSADPFVPGLRLGTLDCNGTAAPVEKTAAYDIVHRFCNEHQGVNIAHGDNFSTSYDTVNATRLHFNVINECAPNGVYLPLDTCLSGFTRVAKCSADCGFAWTAGGQTTMDCMAFDISMEANATPVVGEQGDGVVVSCEGLC